MPRAKKTVEQPVGGYSPAIDPEEREKQLIGLAVSLAEKKLQDGSASNSLILHYIGLASTKMELEKEKLRNENLLLEAKANMIKSSIKSEELYRKALAAMRTYSGLKEVEEDYD